MLGLAAAADQLAPAGRGPIPLCRAAVIHGPGQKPGCIAEPLAAASATGGGGVGLQQALQHGLPSAGGWLTGQHGQGLLHVAAIGVLPRFWFHPGGLFHQVAAESLGQRGPVSCTLPQGGGRCRAGDGSDSLGCIRQPQLRVLAHQGIDPLHQGQQGWTAGRRPGRGGGDGGPAAVAKSPGELSAATTVRPHAPAPAVGRFYQLAQVLLPGLGGGAGHGGVGVGSGRGERKSGSKSGCRWPQMALCHGVNP